jgi:hypothetical protein
MKKKVVLLLFLLLTPLVINLANIQFVNLAEANMVPLIWFPTKPDETSPTITVYSPFENDIFVSSNDSVNVLLNFSVSKPRAWFSSTNLSEDYMPGTVESTVRVVSYNYTVDNGESKNNSVDDDLFHVTGNNPNETLLFSSNLTLLKGVHNITIDVECVSGYVEFEGAGNGYKTVTFYGHSQPVNFIITSPEPFPASLIIAASGTSLAVIAAVLLVYFKKRTKSSGL